MRQYTLILEEPSAALNWKYLIKCPQNDRELYIAFDGLATKKAMFAMINQLRGYCKQPLLFVGRDVGRMVKI